jgi:LAO/AO transport system kinase
VSDLAALGQALQAGDRAALARAITLVESTRRADRLAADRLLEEVLPAAGGALRVSVSGPPGVGKSTLIEALGLRLTDAGARVGVLAIDPTSSRGGGSILGDRTRMIELSRRERAYIRPSPSGGMLGGVARRTREAMVLVEAWGAEVVLLETVGVGQSEVAAAGMVDQFLLLLAPGAGDELQGIKRGVIELADVLVVNKADGELAAAAERARGEYGAALRLLRPKHAGLPTPALACSAMEGRGLDELWATVLERDAALRADGRRDALRSEQSREWLRTELREGVLEALDRHPAARERAAAAERAVAAGELLPPVAADRILSALLDSD